MLSKGDASKWISTVMTAVFAVACAADGDAGRSGPERVGEVSKALTAEDRLAACAQDPRVIAGLVSERVCAGADIFFRETFGGNGRTCGTCHSVENNTTIDVDSVAATPPDDPLFVFRTNPALAELEDEVGLTFRAVIRENIDGFEDPLNKFVHRSVPHVLSMATTITPDTGDGTTAEFVHRTGWSGDGAPGDGSLREFLAGAIKQHYPKTLARESGVDFREPTELEADLVNEFQLALGRLNDLDLTQVNIFDPVANQGREAFLDPQRGRCNVCHFNAGANSQDTGKNRNFDTGNRGIPAIATIGRFPNGMPIFDGGFGGIGDSEPSIDVFNFDPENPGTPNAFGNGTFNTPPLIEAADTPDFFHNNQDGARDIEVAVFFYTDNFPFPMSPAAKELEARFGTPIQFSTEDGFAIGRFLRVLNIAFNLDIAKQRLSAAQTLINRFHDEHVGVQRELIRLAEVEIDDALEVLNGQLVEKPFLPVAVDRLGLAKAEIAAALAPGASWQTRQNRVSNAISRVLNARDQTGSNINFTLGEGNLMF
jgi:hypothetical protein